MPKPPSSGGEEEEKPRGEASEDLCEMALDPELLLLRDDGEEEFGTCSRGARGHRRWLLDWLQCSPVRTGASLAARSLLQAHVRLSAAGAKLEDSEVRSVASNQSEMEFSSLQDMVRPWLCPPTPSPPSGIDAQQGPRRWRGRLLADDFVHLLIGKTQSMVLGSWNGTSLGSRGHFIIFIGVNLSEASGLGAH